MRAIREAIEDAALSPDDIQYVNAHGTSTLKGDQTEIECLRTVFGSRLPALPVSSNKSQIGHSLGAAAAIEAALAIEGMLVQPVRDKVAEKRLIENASGTGVSVR